jgi:hypothetical protein
VLLQASAGTEVKTIGVIDSKLLLDQHECAAAAAAAAADANTSPALAGLLFTSLLQTTITKYCTSCCFMVQV